MDPITGVIGGALTGGVVSLITSLIAAGQEAEAARIRQQIADEYGNAALPNLDKMVAEQLPPEAAARYDKVTQATQSTSNALRGLQGLVDNGGEGAQERAGYLRAGMATSKAETGARSAALRALSARGLSGSPMEAAVLNQSGQEALDRGALMNANEASDAASRRTEALRALGSLGTSARGQEMQAMGAQDAISRFNAAQRQTAQQYNLGLNQQQFDNRMSILAGKSNALNGVANGYERGAQGARQTGAGLANAALTAGAGLTQYYGKKRDDKGDY